MRHWYFSPLRFLLCDGIVISPWNWSRHLWWVFRIPMRTRTVCPCHAASIQILQFLQFPLLLRTYIDRLSCLDFLQLLFCNSFNAVAVVASSILNGDESAPYTRPGVVLLTIYKESWPQNPSLLFSRWRGWTGGNSSSSSQPEKKSLAVISFRILCSGGMVGQRRWTWGTWISSIKPQEMDSGLTTTGTLHGWQQSWLQWYQGLYNWTVFGGTQGLQGMSRLGSMRR